MNLEIEKNRGRSMPKNLMDLTGRVAVVIGGTSGLGRELAIGLATAGADVVPTGRREKMVDEVCTAVEATGVRTLRAVCDIGSRGSVDQFRDAVLAAFGQVDILVNAAGQIFRKPTMDISEKEWDGLMDVNLTGMLRTCQSVYPSLAANRRGRIINIASLNSYVALVQVAARVCRGLEVGRALAHAQSGGRVGAEWRQRERHRPRRVPHRSECGLLPRRAPSAGGELRLRTPMARCGNSQELIGARGVVRVGRGQLHHGPVPGSGWRIPWHRA